MTICYWGGYSGGKKNVKWLMYYNNKKTCHVHQNKIDITHHKVYWDGYISKKQYRCWDIELNKEILYYNGDNLESVSMTRRQLNYIFYPNAPELYVSCDLKKDSSGNYYLTDVRKNSHNLIDTSWVHPLQIHNYERKKLQIDKDLAKKYINDPNLKGTFLQWEAVRQHTPKGKNIEINDIPECHVILPFYRKANLSFSGIDVSKEWNRYRNIVPYKSNLVDSALNAIDMYADDKNGVTENLCLQWYQTDKQKLWNYLEKMVFTNYQDVPRLLKDNGVKFEYFDMDKDSYKKTFMVEREFSGFRNMTYHYINQIKQSRNKKAARKRYSEVKEIATEFIQYMGNPKDNRL
tara:strand:+ start:78 stop:1121 length:1044 start_codon:yes stop_codon:yes gene_type:complete